MDAPTDMVIDPVDGLMDRDAAVRLSPVQQQISPNLEPDFGSGSQIFMNLNLNSRELDFRSSSGVSHAPLGQVWWCGGIRGAGND